MKHAPPVEARNPKIALIDIETAPIKAFAWQMFEANLCHVIEPTFMLSFAYKWYGEKKVHTKALCDYRGYKKDKVNDLALVTDLWNVLDSADMIVAHNGDAFDIKKSNARFIVHGLQPPTPYKQYDTLKAARRCFKFDSNKLDNIGRYLQVGKKLAHTGMHLWLGCMDGDPASWRVMKRYNAQDVRLLESVYEKVKPWDKSHPVLTALAPRLHITCPVCLSADVQRRGWNIAKFRKTPRFQCQSVTCGHWFSGVDHLPKVKAA